MSNEKLVSQVGQAKYLQACSFKEIGEIDKAQTKYEEAKQILANYPVVNCEILYEINKFLESQNVAKVKVATDSEDSSLKANT